MSKRLRPRPSSQGKFRDDREHHATKLSRPAGVSGGVAAQSLHCVGYLRWINRSIERLRVYGIAAADGQFLDVVSAIEPRRAGGRATPAADRSGNHCSTRGVHGNHLRAAMLRSTKSPERETPAVIGSTTTTSLPVASGALLVRAKASSPTFGGTTTSVTKFEKLPSGFCNCTVRVPAVATSEPHECWIAARVPALGLKRSGFEA